MSDLRFVVQIQDKELRSRLKRLVDFPNMEIKDAIGAIVTSQTQRRIDSEKTAPDGKPWEPNSQGTDTLVQSGALRDTIDWEVNGDDVEVGSPLIYAATHQFGATIVPKEAKFLAFAIGGVPVFAKKVTVPARPFLGLSVANENELQNELTLILNRLFS